MNLLPFPNADKTRRVLQRKLQSSENMDNQESLKAAIEQELKKTNPDWRLVEKLSGKEVDADPLNVRFSVDAAHIQRLGLELVAKQETALIELIKNAYDAEASIVTVDFQNHELPGGILVIEDDGIGMSLEIIKEAWMRISTVNKRDNPISPNYGRIRAGRKGIGRFAVQRLGRALILETEVKGSDSGLKVTFNWDSDFTDGKSLNDIFNNVQTYPKDRESQRTRLTILDLREGWSQASLQRAWKAVLLLQPPFKLTKIFKREDSLSKKTDPGFEVVINGTTRKKQETALSIEHGFLDHALAEISGSIDESGRATAKITSYKLDIEDTISFEKSFLLTGPLSFSAKYFIYLPDTLSGLNVSAAKDMARTYGGIRIYRNGFRVLPYGEKTDDWLDLDHDSARRNLLVPAQNQNFFGQVEIDAVLNPLFEETSSREGIIENEAFQELQDFVRSAVEWATKRVAEARSRKTTSSQRDFVSTRPIRTPAEVISGLREQFDKSTSNGSNPPQVIPPNIFEDAQAEVEAWEEEVATKQVESLKYEEMLRILASLGLSITVFGHEIKGVRSSVAANLLNISTITSQLKSSEDRTLLEEGIGWLKTATNRLFDLGGYIAGLMSSTESRELRPLSVRGVLERFNEQFKQYIERQHIDFTIDVQQENLQTISMHSSEIDSILLNLLTNSIKAIKKSKVAQRKIHVRCLEEENYILIRFEDNGTGVPADIAHRIFDPFFTTTIGIEDDSVAGPGTGLGLKIISDIAQSYGGSVRLGTPSATFNCCFEVRIKAAQKQGLFNDF